MFVSLLELVLSFCLNGWNSWSCYYFINSRFPKTTPFYNPCIHIFKNPYTLWLSAEVFSSFKNSWKTRRCFSMISCIIVWFLVLFLSMIDNVQFLNIWCIKSGKQVAIPSRQSNVNEILLSKLHYFVLLKELSHQTTKKLIIKRPLCSLPWQYFSLVFLHYRSFTLRWIKNWYLFETIIFTLQDGQCC